MDVEGTGKGNLREAGRGCFYRITQAFYSMRTCSVILTNVGMDEGLLLVDFVPGGDRNLLQVLQQGRSALGAVCAGGKGARARPSRLDGPMWTGPGGSLKTPQVEDAHSP